MKCEEIRELISLYIDNMLDENTKSQIKSHIEICQDCRKEYEELKNILNACGQLPILELPLDYESNLHRKLLEAKEGLKIEDNNLDVVHKPRKAKSVNWKLMTSIAAMLVVLVISMSVLDFLPMSGNTKQKSTTDSIPREGEFLLPQPAVMPEENEMAGSGGIDTNRNFSINQQETEEIQSIQKDLLLDEGAIQSRMAADTRKIIKHTFLSLDVTGYDEKLSYIMNMTHSYGGYVESANTHLKYYGENQSEGILKMGNLVMRVPENKMEFMVDEIKGLGVVRDFYMDGRDITLEYRDTANEIENLKVQEQRLREIMEKASTVKDILEVEKELSRVRGNINQLEGNIKTWDNQVSLSTIEVSLNEIDSKEQRIQSSNNRLWDKGKKGFIKTVNHMIEVGERCVIAIVTFMPIFLLALLMIIPIFWYVHKKRQPKKK